MKSGLEVSFNRALETVIAAVYRATEQGGFIVAELTACFPITFVVQHVPLV
jgi:hypothetical protein